MKTYKLNFAQFLVNFPIVNSFSNSNNLIQVTVLKICRSKKFKLVKVMIKAIKYQPKQN